MKLKNEQAGWTIDLERVFYVTDLHDNLLSVRQLDKKSIEFVVKDG